MADEVVTGFGRVGEWFACQRWNLEPDIVTTAKGLTSGYIPLGAVIVGERVAEPFFREGATEVFRHGYTYSGHPTACAVGLANLDIIEREGLIERVRALRAGGPASHEAAGRPPARRRRPRGDRAPRGGGGQATKRSRNGRT